MGEQHSHLTHVDLFTTKPCYRKRKTMAKNRKMYEGRTVGRNLDFWTYVLAVLAKYTRSTDMCLFWTLNHYFMLIIVNT